MAFEALGVLRYQGHVQSYAPATSPGRVLGPLADAEALCNLGAFDKQVGASPTSFPGSVLVLSLP